jgi:hypothetical protein
MIVQVTMRNNVHQPFQIVPCVWSIEMTMIQVRKTIKNTSLIDFVCVLLKLNSSGVVVGGRVVHQIKWLISTADRLIFVILINAMVQAVKLC